MTSVDLTTFPLTNIDLTNFDVAAMLAPASAGTQSISQVR